MRYAFLLILMMAATLGNQTHAKKAPGYYVTYKNDTVHVVFRFEEANIASDIYRYQSGKQVVLTSKEAKLVMIDMGDRMLRFISRSGIVNFYESSNGFLKITERKEIAPNDTLHRYPVFMQVYSDTGSVTFGSVDYYYYCVRYNRYVLQKGSNDYYFLTSEPVKVEMLKYFDDCPLVKQQILNTQKRNPPIKEFVLSLVKTYNANCTPE